MKSLFQISSPFKKLSRLAVVSLFLVPALLLSGCNKLEELLHEKGGNSPGLGNPSMLLEWNDAATQVIYRMGTGPNGPLPPMPESRFYALVNVAMHDALNSIIPVYHTYALKSALVPEANPDAAVAKAAHDIFVAEFPPQTVYADSLFQAVMANIQEGDPKTKGISLGQAAAAAMEALRSNDGAVNAQTAFTPGTLPGQYRATPPFDGPPYNGFVAVPGWGKITPFGLQTDSQFRPVPPYEINSSAYTADYNEAKNLGASVNSTRTPDQTQIGLFWLENSPLGWNRIARGLLTQKNLDAWTDARLLGTLHMALADANFSSLEAKFYYIYWRPITAIRLGDDDGNSKTIGNAVWDVLAPPTPPVPDYPSNHAVNGGAASQVLAEFFRNDNVSFAATSTSLTGITRYYGSFSQAARDNSLSRIYAGYHFRNAVLKGEAQGKKVGDYVFNHVLQPL